MLKTAFIFPGQGSQKIGMGSDLYQNFQAFKDVFDEASEAVSIDLKKIVFGNDEAVLNKTENAQVALVAMSVGVFRTLLSELGWNLNKMAEDNAFFVAGHSLGEYSALTSAGAVELSDMMKFIRQRGDIMSSAVADGVGGMMAVLGLDKDSVKQIAEKASVNENDLCEIANDNCPGQIVLSGHVTALKRAEVIAKEMGAKRAVMLAVSKPAHCSLMKSAQENLKPLMEVLHFNAPILPFVSNNSAKVENDVSVIKNQLIAQTTCGVRWVECVNFMIENGVQRFVEVGSGAVLSGLVKKIIPSDSQIVVESINNIQGVSDYVQSIR